MRSKIALYSLIAFLACAVPASAALTLGAQEAVSLPVERSLDIPEAAGSETVTETGWFQVTGSVSDAVPAGEAPETVRPVVALPGVPSALLMTLLGCLCVGLVKGRRKWVAGVIALCSVCQAGLGSLPKLAAALSGRQSVELSAAGSVHPERYRLHVKGATSDIEYVGLLRRLGSEPADSALDVTESVSTPAVDAFSRRSTAGSFVEPVDSPVALSPNGAAFQRDVLCVLQPRRATSIPSSQATPYALLARPPPVAA